MKFKKVIEIKNLSKKYNKKNNEIVIFNNVNLKFYSNTLYVIKGESGSGKSTLLNIIGLLDNDCICEYYLDDTLISNYSDNYLSKIRLNNMGFVFQDFKLKCNLNAYENIILPTFFNKHFDDKKILKIISNLKLNDRINHFPNELSGGEQQRVALARALVNNPKIILADEPTGNLDSDNEKKIMTLLNKMSKSGKCVIVVSHSDKVLNYADIVLEIKDNKIVEIKNGFKEVRKFYTV